MEDEVNEKSSTATNSPASILRRYLPILDWGAKYSRQTFVNDLITAGIVTVMLIPQSLAYAQLAGLPPQVGLYASMAPLVLYAIFGSSSSLAVGPVAVGSLMTAAAIAPLASQGTPEYLAAAMALAFVSGIILLVLGILRLGFLTNFISHPVISGFITASGIQIAAGQLSSLLGISAGGHTFVEIVESLGRNIEQISLPTTIIGVPAFLFLFWTKSRLEPFLVRLGLRKRLANILAKIGPVAAIIVTTLVVWVFELNLQGVKIVAEVPTGLPELTTPSIDAALWTEILVPAMLISLIGYVESISVAHTLASKRRQRIDPDQELIALGAANISASVTGGFPVTGGFSRSVVNYEAGAETPAAGAFTALGIAIATIFLTPLLFFLPKTTLAATIMVAVLSLVDLGALKRTYAYSPTDAFAMAITILLTLLSGVETGLIAGVALSVFLHLYRTSRPHTAIVGQVPGTQFFRNIERHNVVTDPEVVSIRVDESLYFPNARFVEDRINEIVADNPAVRHIILVCPAVNAIDASALESLEAINHRLKDGNICFHLSTVKGPVMDRLKGTKFLNELTGKIHFTQFDAVSSINPELARKTLEEQRS